MVGQATAFFQHLKEQNPNEAFAHFGLGQVFLAKRQYDSAIPEFRQALALGSQNEPRSFFSRSDPAASGALRRRSDNLQKPPGAKSE
jgi:tetratricopeptide (TPR) repeat protein